MRGVIRPPAPSDFDALVDLSRRTIQASYRSFLGDDAVAAYLGSGAIERFFSEQLDRCLVLECDGLIAGVAVHRENLIDLLLVDPAFQRQGLGAMLLEHVERLLFRSHDTLILESFEGNRAANAFYRRQGWTEAGRLTDDGEMPPKLCFEKSGEGRTCAAASGGP